MRQLIFTKFDTLLNSIRHTFYFVVHSITLRGNIETTWLNGINFPLLFLTQWSSFQSEITGNTGLGSQFLGKGIKHKCLFKYPCLKGILSEISHLEQSLNSKNFRKLVASFEQMWNKAKCVPMLSKSEKSQNCTILH